MDVTVGPFKGLNNVLAPEERGIEWLTDALNADVTNTGRIRKRGGFKRVYAGAGVHSAWSCRDLTAAGYLLLFREGNALCALSTAFAKAVLVSGLAGGLRMSFSFIDSRVYFSDALQNGILELSSMTARSWGLPVPGVPTLAAAAGNLIEGRYHVVLTYRRGDGQESGAGVGAYVDVPAGGGIDITGIPQPSDPDITRIDVWMTHAGGDVFFLAQEIPVGTLSTSYAGDTTEFKYSLQTQFLNPPPPGQLIEWFRGRMLVAAGDVVLISEEYGYELFDLRDYVTFERYITALDAVDDGVYVGTTEALYFLPLGDGSSEAVFGPLMLACDYGALFGSAAKCRSEKIGDGSGKGAAIIYETRRGKVAAMNSGSVLNLTIASYVYPAGTMGAGAVIEQDGLIKHIGVVLDPDGKALNEYKFIATGRMTLLIMTITGG